MRELKNLHDLDEFIDTSLILVIDDYATIEDFVYSRVIHHPLFVAWEDDQDSFVPVYLLMIMFGQELVKSLPQVQRRLQWAHWDNMALDTHPPFLDDLISEPSNSGRVGSDDEVSDYTVDGQDPPQQHQPIPKRALASSDNEIDDLCGHLSKKATLEAWSEDSSSDEDSAADKVAIPLPGVRNAARWKEDAIQLRETLEEVRNANTRFYIKMRLMFLIHQRDLQTMAQLRQDLHEWEKYGVKRA